MPRDPAKRPLDDRIRAQHMLEGARDAAAMAAGRSRSDLDADMMLRRALINAVQEIGEAAAKISPAGRQRLAALPWKQIIGMRNKLVHGYDEINLDMLWTVAAEELPSLIAALEAELAGWPLPPPME